MSDSEEAIVARMFFQIDTKIYFARKAEGKEASVA